MTRSTWLAWLVGFTLLLLGVRGLGLALEAVPFNGDEAVVALMARHILQGARPVFFYGQAYMGSLDAWLVAGAFAVFGQQVWVVRAVQVGLAALTLWASAGLVWQIYRSPGMVALALAWLAVLPVMGVLYSTVTLGGYGEVALLGTLCLWLTVRLVQGVGGRWHWAALGLAGGVGFWAFPLMGVYLLPCALTLGRARPAGWLAGGALAGAMFALGSAPWWWFTVQNGLVTVQEMTGAAIAGATAPSPLAAAARHGLNFLLFAPTVVTGMRPSWSAEILAWPLAPVAVLVYGAAGLFQLHLWRTRAARPAGHGVLAGLMLTSILAFVFTPFGADPSGRYFLPLFLPVALSVAELAHAAQARWRGWPVVLMGAVVAYHLAGTVQAVLTYPPGLTTQFYPPARVDMRTLPALMDFLHASGETRGYSTYWVSTPMAFLSQETLIFDARLPYHLDLRYTPRDSRYPPYTAQVNASERVAYITVNHPALDDRLRAGLAALGVEYREQVVDEFRVFYALSRPVRPAEMGLGVWCCDQ